MGTQTCFPQPIASSAPAPEAVLARLYRVGTVEGFTASQIQPPYILTHFPGCENSHQRAERREEQVAVTAKRLPGLTTFSLGGAVCVLSSLVCWSALRKEPERRITSSAHLLLRSAQAGRQEMSPHLTDLPTLGGLTGHSTTCTGGEIKAWREQCLALGK